MCTATRVPDYRSVIARSKASVIFAEKGMNLDGLKLDKKAVVLVDNPREAIVAVLNRCFPIEKPSPAIHKSAIVDKAAKIDKTAYVGAGCVLGRCEIGAKSIIHPNVVINDGVRIGKNVVICPGTVIGFDGFGYGKGPDGELANFPHYGGVVIEDDVEIGSNTSIDRGTLGDTIIRNGAKIDNLCHIAHNVVIGENSMVIAHAMVGGSTEIGDDSWVAPGAILRDGISIGNKSLVGLGAVVTRSVPDGEIVVGNPAKPYVPKVKK